MERFFYEYFLYFEVKIKDQVIQNQVFTIRITKKKKSSNKKTLSNGTIKSIKKRIDVNNLLKSPFVKLDKNVIFFDEH